jgi:hypothetical protein
LKVISYSLHDIKSAGKLTISLFSDLTPELPHHLGASLLQAAEVKGMALRFNFTECCGSAENGKKVPSNQIGVGALMNTGFRSLKLLLAPEHSTKSSGVSGRRHR